MGVDVGKGRGIWQLLRKLFEALVGLFRRRRPKPPQHAVHAFYYSWYGNPDIDGSWRHWNRADRVDHYPPEDVASDFYPYLGPYSSNDPKTLKRHMIWLKRACVAVIVISWWGRGKQGEFERMTIPKILDAAVEHGIKVAWHIEPYTRRSARSVELDIKHIMKEYGNHPAFFRDPDYGDRPIFYIYDSGRISAEDWAKMIDGLRGTENDTVILAQTMDREMVLRGHFDGFYNYDLVHPRIEDWKDHAKWSRKNKRVFVPSVGPGYIDRRAKHENDRAGVVDRRDGETYDEMWEAAVESEAERVSITSFNEWHEGTQIEPAKRKRISGFAYSYYGKDPWFYIKRTREWVGRYIGPTNQ